MMSFSSIWQFLFDCIFIDIYLEWIRFFRCSYPRVSKHTIPELSDVPFNELDANEKFLAYGDGITKILNGLIDYIDDDWRSEQIKETNLKQYLDPIIPARLQLTVLF